MEFKEMGTDVVEEGTGKRPGIFGRLLGKVDAVLKAKAEAKAEEGCGCCGEEGESKGERGRSKGKRCC